MDLATLLAALIAAFAAVVAARRSSEAAERIQSREHDRRDFEREVETCGDLYAQFIDAVRGAGVETNGSDNRSSDWWEWSMSALLNVAKGCHERAAKAGHVAAKIRIFCAEEVADAADAAVDAVSQYGFAIMYAVGVQDDPEERDSANSRMTRAGKAYQASVIQFQESAKDAR